MRYRTVVAESDVERIAKIEEASYPADEKASFDALKFRAEQAREFFLVVVEEDLTPPSSSERGRGEEKIVGYVCGTLSREDTLTKQSMKEHHADGTHLLIHSVCVEERRRRRKIGTKLLEAYLMYVKARNNDNKNDDRKDADGNKNGVVVKKISLICKRELVRFYEDAGFEYKGPSLVCHGKDAWFECEMRIPT